jgi:hypothetical protein
MVGVNFKIDDSEIEGINAILKEMKELGYKEDIFIPLSALVSASTDNAKDLLLDIINCGTDLASVYIYLLDIGVDIESIVEFMTSKGVTMVSKKSRSQEFIESRITINMGIDYFAETVNYDRYELTPYMGTIDTIVKNIFDNNSILKSKADDIVNGYKYVDSEGNTIFVKGLTDMVKFSNPNNVYFNID